MARRRFFVDDVAHGYAEITGEDAHHLIRVLRVQPGQLYEISDNRSVYLAEVESVAPKKVRLRVCEAIPTPDTAARIRLMAALIKFDRFEWMIEKATELGVDSILPVECERSEKGLLAAWEKRAERWRRIVRESSQQSRRARLPEILAPRALAAALREATGVRCYLDEQGGRPLSEKPGAAEVWLAIGPEGGWTDGERRGFDENGWTAASLGPGILRAETAAIAAIAVLAHTSWANQMRPSEPHPLQ
jgi:16S rRNA (uracil1498-N3)-methyltransferase